MNHVSLSGSSRRRLPHTHLVGLIDRLEMASLTVRVRSRGDLAALEEQVHSQSDQPLAQRRYLSHEEFEQQYGADPADIELVEQFAQEHGLTAVRRSLGERSITLNGRLGDLVDAFHADVQMVRHSSGISRARQGEISVPEHLQGIVTGVFGFDTRPKFRGKHQHTLQAEATPGGQYGVAATDYAKRYNFPTEFEGVALDGTGQTIALVELGGGFQRSDLATYFQEINVPLPNIVAVSVNGVQNSPTTPNPYDIEVMLDIEVVGAVAPGAMIAVYFAPNGEQGLLDAISTVVHDTKRKPSVLSISWGEPEDNLDQHNLSAFHEVFMTAATMGITVCVASSDHGTATLAASDWDDKIHVHHPAGDDLVLACGGTQIEDGVDVVWNDGTPFSSKGGGWASGGGISKRFPVPAYQTDAALPVSLVPGKPGRGVPDIAMSAVAPLMAALVALLNQAK